jgi:predicted peptidase
MRIRLITARALVVSTLAVWLALGVAPGTGRAQENGRGRGPGGLVQSTDPRVQNRTYHFADTNVDLPYCVFVSSRVSREKKNPLIVSLHGFGIGPGFMCRGKALDLAEEGGYILVAPMGYRIDGWYGSPVIEMRGRAGQPAPPPPPPNLAELSETDVLNVLAMMKKEFNVDERRTYLMGHSMGGAGTLFLGAKHPAEWAAIAAMAPASFRMNDTRSAVLQKIKDGAVPVIVTHGDADTVVPVTNTQMWIATMKDLQLNYQYKEIPGADHGTVIEQGMPDIFAFFKDHATPAR